MDDDSCVLKYIEIVPLDNFNNFSDVTHIKQEPDTVKVYLICAFVCKAPCKALNAPLQLAFCLSHDLTYHLAAAPFVLLLRLSGTVSHLMSAHVLLSQHFVNI